MQESGANTGRYVTSKQPETVPSTDVTLAYTKILSLIHGEEAGTLYNRSQRFDRLSWLVDQ